MMEISHLTSHHLVWNKKWKIGILTNYTKYLRSHNIVIAQAWNNTNTLHLRKVRIAIKNIKIKLWYTSDRVGPFSYIINCLFNKIQLGRMEAPASTLQQNNVSLQCCIWCKYKSQAHIPSGKKVAHNALIVSNVEGTAARLLKSNLIFVTYNNNNCLTLIFALNTLILCNVALSTFFFA